MSGHVVETHTKQIKRGQFQDTLNMLKIYLSTQFKQDVNYFTPLFSQFREPAVKKSPDPVKTEVKDEDRNITKITSTFDKMVF